MTARTYIRRALSLLGVLAQGETSTSDEVNDAFLTLNDMIDEWASEQLMIFHVVRNVFTLVANTQTYTLGPGGAFNVVRPVWIDRASVILLDNPASPQEVKIELFTDQAWQGTGIKNIGSQPSAVYDDGAFPLRTLSYFPYPNVAMQTALYLPTALAQFADLDTDYTFPPAYRKAIRASLAVELAPEFGVQASDLVRTQARDAVAIIKRTNSGHDMTELRCEPAMVGRGGGRGMYNILSDR